MLSFAPARQRLPGMRRVSLARSPVASRASSNRREIVFFMTCPRGWLLPGGAELRFRSRDARIANSSGRGCRGSRDSESRKPTLLIGWVLVMLATVSLFWLFYSENYQPGVRDALIAGPLLIGLVLLHFALIGAGNRLPAGDAD